MGNLEHIDSIESSKPYSQAFMQITILKLSGRRVGASQLNIMFNYIQMLVLKLVFSYTYG